MERVNVTHTRKHKKGIGQLFFVFSFFFFFVMVGNRFVGNENNITKKMGTKDVKT